MDKSNPCKTCLTLAMCRNRVRETYKTTDFNVCTDDDVINREVLILALRNHCSIFVKIVEIPKHEGDRITSYDLQRTLNLAETLGLKKKRREEDE